MWTVQSTWLSKHQGLGGKGSTVVHLSFVLVLGRLCYVLCPVQCTIQRNPTIKVSGGECCSRVLDVPITAFLDGLPYISQRVYSTEYRITQQSGSWEVRCCGRGFVAVYALLSGMFGAF